MTCEKKRESAGAKRFREHALPCLDDAYRFAYFFLQNRSNAEDAVQDCYLRAWRHFDTWCGLSFKPWLLAILRNVCYSRLSREGRQDISVDMTDPEYHLGETLWNEAVVLPDAPLLDREQSALVQEAIFSLPPQFREILILRHFDDMSYRKIADVVGVPIGTVMSRLARARALFSRAWKAEGKAQSDPKTFTASHEVFRRFDRHSEPSIGAAQARP